MQYKRKINGLIKRKFENGKKDWKGRVLKNILDSLKENENYIVYADTDYEDDLEWRNHKLKYPIINIIDKTSKLEIEDVWDTLENIYGKYIKSYNLTINNFHIMIRIKWNYNNVV